MQRKLLLYIYIYIRTLAGIPLSAVPFFADILATIDLISSVVTSSRLKSYSQPGETGIYIYIYSGCRRAQLAGTVSDNVGNLSTH